MLASMLASKVLGGGRVVAYHGPKQVFPKALVSNLLMNGAGTFDVKLEDA